jgi:hypothetical protein
MAKKFDWGLIVAIACLVVAIVLYFRFGFSGF